MNNDKLYFESITPNTLKISNESFIIDKIQLDKRFEKSHERRKPVLLEEYYKNNTPSRETLPDDVLKRLLDEENDDFIFNFKIDYFAHLFQQHIRNMINCERFMTLFVNINIDTIKSGDRIMNIIVQLFLRYSNLSKKEDNLLYKTLKEIYLKNNEEYVSILEKHIKNRGIAENLALRVPDPRVSLLNFNYNTIIFSYTLCAEGIYFRKNFTNEDEDGFIWADELENMIISLYDELYHDKHTLCKLLLLDKKEKQYEINIRNKRGNQLVYSCITSAVLHFMENMTDRELENLLVDYCKARKNHSIPRRVRLYTEINRVDYERIHTCMDKIVEENNYLKLKLN